MRRILAAASLLALVAGCTSAQIQKAQTDIANVDSTLLATVAAGCATFAPIAAPLTAAPNAALANIAQTGAGMCDLATGKISASGVPNIDTNTAAWLGLLSGMLKAAATPAPAPAI